MYRHFVVRGLRQLRWGRSQPLVSSSSELRKQSLQPERKTCQRHK